MAYRDFFLLVCLRGFGPAGAVSIFPLVSNPLAKIERAA